MKQLIRLLVAVCISTSTTYGQQDSLQQDSIVRVTEADAVATQVPAGYAQLIIELNEEFVPSITAAQTRIFSSELGNLDNKYAELSRLTDFVLRRNNVLESLKNIENKWEDHVDQVARYSQNLKQRTDDIIELRQALTDDRKGWVEVNDKLQFGEHPEAIMNYATVSIDTIDFYLDASAKVIDTVTVVYTQLVDLLLNSKDYAERINALRRVRITELLRERKEPIWSIPLRVSMEGANEHVQYLRTIGLGDATYYLQKHSVALLQTVLFFAILLYIFLWTRRRSLSLDDSEEPELVRNEHILHQPFLMSSLATIVIATLVLPNLPPLISYVIALGMFVCVVGVLFTMMRGSLRWVAVVLCTLFLIFLFSGFYGGTETDTRWMALLVSSVVLGMMVWVRRNRSQLLAGAEKGTWQRFMVWISWVVILLATSSLVLNVIGYGIVADIVNRGSVLALIIGLMLVAMYQAFNSIVFHFLHTNLANQSVIIHEGGSLIFRRIMNIIRYSLILVYAYYILSFFLLWEFVQTSVRGVLGLGYTFGSIELTIGDLVDVFATVMVFWLLATLIRQLLRRELFSRIKLPRGIGNAISSITYYTLIVVGVFLAFATAGFDTRHLGILAGALGVGIGFGLQTIVNNFLSGLILVFERPITVDDVIEVDGILGVVTNIGIRSSTIRQFNGDEVIIPNADLIAKKVTNRTLSNTHRRWTMTFETGRGVDADMVINLIKHAASDVEGVLKDPPVQAYFKGMGTQSVKFYVNYWAASNFLDLVSNVEKAVYQALEKAEVQMPIPVQIEVQKKEKRKS